MEVTGSKFEKYVFVCENQREAGKECCMPQGSHIRETLKDLVKAEGLAPRIRVGKAGCLDVCAEGPSVLIMPDNIRLARVQAQDAGRILELLRKNLTPKGV